MELRDSSCRKRFDFDLVNLTSQVYTLSKVNMADSTSRESSSISGSDYSNFEASMEGEHSERVYESVGEINSPCVAAASMKKAKMVSAFMIVNKVSENQSLI